jgi:hypothetical protein
MDDIIVTQRRSEPRNFYFSPVIEDKLLLLKYWLDPYEWSVMKKKKKGEKLK